MTVRSPSQYDGATIEGYVTNVNRSGRVTGRSEMTLNFDTIRLRNGRTYRFAGIVETVRTPSNETVRVDNEGAVREDDQTGRTIQRTAIGTAVGAIIGAIAGGGKGAAIGAVIGAGAGAGSVYVQGREDLELTTGTEFTIRASGPRLNGYDVSAAHVKCTGYGRRLRAVRIFIRASSRRSQRAVAGARPARLIRVG